MTVTAMAMILIRQRIGSIDFYCRGVCGSFPASNYSPMDLIDKIDQCRYIIDRFDHYNDSVNSKVALYLSINTFVLGGICIGYYTVRTEIKQCEVLFHFVMALAACVLLACLASLWCTAKAVTPYLKDNHVNDDQPSLIYFGGISRYTCNDFVSRLLAQEEPLMLEDFARQTHSLAKGLDNKFKWLTCASRCLFAEYLLLIILIFVLFIIL